MLVVDVRLFNLNLLTPRRHVLQSLLFAPRPLDPLIGFHCGPKGPFQGRRPPQNRIRGICARGLKTKTRLVVYEALGGHR